MCSARKLHCCTISMAWLRDHPGWSLSLILPRPSWWCSWHSYHTTFCATVLYAGSQSIPLAYPISSRKRLKAGDLLYFVESVRCISSTRLAVRTQSARSLHIRHVCCIIKRAASCFGRAGFNAKSAWQSLIWTGHKRREPAYRAKMPWSSGFPQLRPLFSKNQPIISLQSSTARHARDYLLKSTDGGYRYIGSRTSKLLTFCSFEA